MNATGKLMAVGWDGRMDLQVAKHAGWHTHTPPPPGDRPLMRDTVVLTTLEVKMHDVRVVLASTSYTAPPKKLACAVQAAADHSKSSPHDCGRRANTLHHEDACGTLAWRRQRRCGEGGGGGEDEEVWAKKLVTRCRQLLPTVLLVKLEEEMMNSP